MKWAAQTLSPDLYTLVLYNVLGILIYSAEITLEEVIKEKDSEQHIK